jgi:sugar lactone lactonase YvrE
MERNSNSLNRSTIWTRQRVILLVFLIGLSLRLWAAWQLPVDFDEPTYLDAGYQYAQMIQTGDINGIIDFSGTSEHPPLIKLLYGVVILVMGQGANWDQALLFSRLMSVMFGSLSVLLIALVDPLAGGLMAVQTLVVKYTSQAYLEALPFFFALVAVVLLRRSTSARSKSFILSAIALGITAAGKYSYFPILFVILFILIWEQHERINNILLYIFLAAITFFIFNPYLWHDPISRLGASLSFHTQYAQGAHVQEVAYPWYQPFLWVSRSNGFVWHPEVFFYFGVDGLIFLLALPGLWLEWRHIRWVVVWTITSMLTLLIWPTKWPQYTLVVLPALCLAASAAAKEVYEKLREQELYWEWFHNMFPRPTRRYIIIAAFLMGLLVVGVMVSQAFIAINRIGWSSITDVTSGLPNNAVNDIQALPDGRMLIGTDGGVAIWKAASEDEVMDEWVVFTPSNSMLPHQQVLAVLQDKSGVFWFGTGSGLARYDGNNWDVFRAKDFGLNNEQINTIVEDVHNQIWIGTLEGVSRYDGAVWTPFTKETSGLVNNVVFSSVVQAKATTDVVWFGTLNGISALDLTTDNWKNFTRQDIDLGWGGVSDLSFDSSGRLWVSTEGDGISVWDGTNWSYLRVSNSHLPYSIVEAVSELEPGVFWIATSIPNASGGVVAKYDGTTWHIYRQNLSGYSGAETVTIAKDLTGRYWFGTRTDGIDIYEPRK